MIKVIGWYGKHNVGDESYKLSFPQLFPRAHLDFQNTSDHYEACLLGGGDILCKEYLERALNLSCARRIIFSTSVPSTTPIELVKKFDQVFVRDRLSVERLRQHEVPCQYMPDAAFALAHNPAAGKALIKELFTQEERELYAKKVVVILNSHLLRRVELLARDLMSFLHAVQNITKVADETAASFIFLPMSTGSPYDDRATNWYASHFCKFWAKNLVVSERLNVKDTLNLIAGCDAVISTRLHSSIFSTISHVPFIDLTHHDKNRNFLNSVEWDVSLDYWNFTASDLSERLNTILEHGEYRKKLEEIHRQQTLILQNVVSNVRFT